MHCCPSQVHPVAAAEIEVSPWEYGVNQKAVIETAKELGVCVLAYSYGPPPLALEMALTSYLGMHSPLGRGFLTGQIKKFDDIPGEPEAPPSFASGH